MLRLLVIAVGLLCFAPIVLLAREVFARPSLPGFTALGVTILGPLGGPFLVSRWDRWSALDRRNRLAIVFVTAYVTPFVLALLGRFPNPANLLTFNLPVAAGVTALWWVRRGLPARPAEPG